ncbi:S9 family peptidase [Crocinitomix catalasitica]|uniref:S9 family peptidase n=1 Tax=Crocinitomix catalasitica TaxID=184607 RepID=UPI00055D11AF|nr:S9 family peptidase [Crocinitomix catalasitica]
MKLIGISLLLFLSLITSNVIGQDKKVTNELIWASREFSAEYVRGIQSMQNGKYFTVIEDNSICKYSYENFGEKKEVLVSNNDLKGKSIEEYSFNADESKLLVATDVEPIYRRSFKANFFIFDLKTKELIELYDKGKQMLADFSPDGSKIAFVYQNNLYYKDLKNYQVTQITNDGIKNEIINGSTDWVYEEEFSITKAFHWSPKGTKIAYLKFNEAKVENFTMDYYLGNTYPEAYTFKYPKAGEDNSELKLIVYSLDSNEKLGINIGNYEYVPRMSWTNNDNQLLFLVMNRHQNELSYVLTEIKNGKLGSGGIIYSDRSETYVEVDDNLLFLSDGKSFLRTSEKNGFNHIYRVWFDGNEKQITKGDWDVVDLLGVNNEKDVIYYTSVEEGAIYKTLYGIGIDGKNKIKLSTKKGYNSPNFSKGMKFYINEYSNSQTPPEFTLCNDKGGELKIIKDNQELKNTLKKYDFQTKEFIKIKGEDGMLNAFIIRPPNFDRGKKYPVYFNIYGGPGHNLVTDSWGGSNYLYHQLLAQSGYIVISVDPRGTMYRGERFKKSTYMQLGKLETEDMIAVAKEVKKWNYVDPDRIGVMGWSYGGYMSSLCMTKGADHFNMGIAVAPVTNWRWYDNIYTERFMRTPKENADGYDLNSPINFVEHLKGKYLLIHGTGDDNVHVQNSLEMVNALVRENIEFDMFFYTNKNHGISGGYTRLHLFNKLYNYTLNNL